MHQSDPHDSKAEPGTNGKSMKEQNLSTDRCIREVLYNETGTSWISDITKVLGKPRKILSPETGAYLTQETVVYYLPETKKSIYEKDFEGTILNITRDFDDIDPLFKVHLSVRKARQAEKVIFNSEVIAIQINFEAQYVEFWTASESEDVLVAHVTQKGIEESELVK